MEKQLMQRFYDVLDEGIQIADGIRKNSAHEMMCIREVQSAMSAFSKEKELPKLVNEILEAHPEKRYELQKRIIAFMGEGKKVENSLIR